MALPYDADTLAEQEDLLLAGGEIEDQEKDNSPLIFGDEELETPSDAGADDGNEEAEESPVKADAGLSAEDKELLAFAKTSVGQRAFRELSGLIAEHGIEGVESMLNAPDATTQQQALQERVAAHLRPIVDEGGYDLNDPLVATIARMIEKEERAEMAAEITSVQAQQKLYETRVDAAVTGALKKYPDADPAALKIAIGAGADPEQFARQSHIHFQNLQTRARATMEKIPGARVQGAPTPLKPGSGTRPRVGGDSIPDPTKDPAGFAEFEERMLAKTRR